MREPPPDLVTHLRRLPQASHFTDRQAEAWATAVERQQAADALGGLTLAQHLRRLGGFGASEIGVLVEERRGGYSPFATARELVARKLLLEFPAPADEHMRRGLAMEPLIREAFLRQTGATRLEALTRQVAAHAPARHPWMQCTPDDFVALDGRLVLVDYKAPAEPLAALPLPYACQLHQIGLIAEDLGYPVDHRALVAWNHPRGRPEVLACEFDPALAAEIVAAGEHYWNAHVLAGELPPWPARGGRALNLADLSLEAKAELAELAERWLRLEVLAQESERLTEAARAALVARCRSHGLAEAVDSGPVRIKPRAAWDPDAVEARLPPAERARFERPRYDLARLAEQVRALGGDPETARTADAAPLDLDAAARWLIAKKGVPETVLQTTDYRPSLSRRKADLPFVTPVREAAQDRARRFDPSIRP
jgi:hypothetical protein